MRIVAGCDGGGTKCDVCVFVCDDHGNILRTAQAQSGPANVKSNPELTLQNIRTATSRAMRAARVSPDVKIDAFVVALAGAGDVNRQKEWQTILSESIPVIRLRVVPDAAVLFAAADADGEPSDEAIAMVVGTGSIVWARDRDGRMKRAGGLGPVIGDEGSGYWIGREAIRRLAARESSPETMQLAERVRGHFPGCDLAELASAARSGSANHHEIAALTKDVFEVAVADELSQKIIAQAADHMAQQLVEAASQLGMLKTKPVCWLCAGGVAVNQPTWLQTIRSKCEDEDLFLGQPSLIAGPVIGAAKLALEQMTSGHSPENT